MILDDAYNYLKLRGLDGNHCTVSKVEETPAENHMNGTALYPGLQKDRSEVENEHRFGNSLETSTEKHVAPSPAHFQTPQMPKLILWSAMDEAGVKRLSSLYGKHLSQLDNFTFSDTYLDRLVYTLNERRGGLPWKSFSVVHRLEDLQKTKLESSKPVRSISRPSLALIFTGQGAQWAQMGQELLQFPVFEQSLKNADDYMRIIGARWSLIREIFNGKAESRVDEPDLSQPLCTALQVALVDLLRSFKVCPSVVLGHSSGEIAAAYSTGALSKESAWKIAYFRGALTASAATSTKSPGAMLAVGKSEFEVQTYLDRIRRRFGNSRVTVGCFNSPKSITLTGCADQIQALKEVFDENAIFARKLRVKVAYHSPYMQSIVPEYLARMKDLVPDSTVEREAMPAMISSVTAEWITAEDVCNGQYWVRNLLLPVRFSEALSMALSRSKAMQQDSNPFSQSLNPITDLLEIGPHAALQGPIREISKAVLKSQKVEYHAALIRDVPADRTMIETLGQLHCRGHSVSVSSINTGVSGSTGRLSPLVDLPEYPFDHSRSYWQESRLSKSYRFRPHARNLFLGVPVPDCNPFEARWRLVLRMEDNPWIEDHKV